MSFWIGKRATLGLALLLGVLVADCIVGYRNIEYLHQSDRRVSHSNEVLAGLEAVLSTLKDAETGERGYLITGNRDYLKPYLSAVRSVQDRVQRLRDLTADNPVQSRALPSSPRSRTKSWPSFAGRSMFETLWDSTPHAPW